MTNRVDELEGQIAELRAAVNGLTEELVETKSRVRELEAEAAEEADPEPQSNGTRTQNDDHVMVVEHERDGIGHSTETTESLEETTADANETEADAENEESEIETDDIIVA